MFQDEPYSWVQIRKMILVTCLVLVIIYLPVFISWRIYQYRAVNELVQAIESFDNEETEVAIEKVKTRDATELALPKLIELLETDKKVAFSYALSRAFYEMGHEGISLLLEKIEPSQKTNTRVRAIYVLRILGSSQLDNAEFQRIVNAFIQALNDENKEVRFTAAQAIPHIDPSKSNETLPTLVEFLLKDPDPGLRFNAAYSIGLFGKRAESALSDLVLALEDPVSTVRVLAARAIVNVGVLDQRVLEALVEMLSDENHSCQSEAAGSLGQFGLQAVPAVPALVTLLTSLQDVKTKEENEQSNQDWVRISVIQALGDIGYSSSEVIQTLVDELNDQRLDYSRECAAIALGKLGPQAVGAVPDLVRVRDEAKMDTRSISENSMGIEFENRLGLEAEIALENIDPVKFNRALYEPETKAQ